MCGRVFFAKPLSIKCFLTYSSASFILFLVLHILHLFSQDSFLNYLLFLLLPLLLFLFQAQLVHLFFLSFFILFFLFLFFLFLLFLDFFRRLSPHQCHHFIISLSIFTRNTPILFYSFHFFIACIQVSAIYNIYIILSL